MFGSTGAETIRQPALGSRTGEGSLRHGSESVGSSDRREPWVPRGGAAEARSHLLGRNRCFHDIESRKHHLLRPPEGLKVPVEVT
jgi:hypothetical protein